MLVKSELCLPGIDRMEWFHIPSRLCVTASLIAGRCDSGRDSISAAGGSLRRATSFIALYLIGAEACSKTQLRGNESGSAAGAGIVGANSGVIVGAVTSGARHAERSKPWKPAH